MLKFERKFKSFSKEEENKNSLVIVVVVVDVVYIPGNDRYNILGKKMRLLRFRAGDAAKLAMRPNHQPIRVELTNMVSLYINIRRNWFLSINNTASCQAVIPRPEVV